MNNGLSCILLPREDDNSKETPAQWQSIANSSKVGGMALVFGGCYNFSIYRTSSDNFFILFTSSLVSGPTTTLLNYLRSRLSEGEGLCFHAPYLIIPSFSCLICSADVGIHIFYSIRNFHDF